MRVEFSGLRVQGVGCTFPLHRPRTPPDRCGGCRCPADTLDRTVPRAASCTSPPRNPCRGQRHVCQVDREIERGESETTGSNPWSEREREVDLARPLFARRRWNETLGGAGPPPTPDYKTLHSRVFHTWTTFRSGHSTSTGVPRSLETAPPPGPP